MHSDQISVMEQCVHQSFEGTMSFPEVVRRLTQIGVERYHADYSRKEKTYYLPDGQSHVVANSDFSASIAMEFSPAGVQAALRAVQLGQIDYREFLRQTMAAGCVGYFVLIAGRQALYFGRKGEVYVEKFPSAK